LISNAYPVQKAAGGWFVLTQPAHSIIRMRILPLSPTAAWSDAMPALFGRMATLNVGVIGDFALDLYYQLNTETGEYSLETNRPVYWGSRPKASLGAAGNVIQNLLALGVGQIWAIGVVGADLFGHAMRQLMQEQGVHTNCLLTAPPGWDTCVYTKPMQQQTEANRIDFGSQNKLPDPDFDQLLDGLAQLLPQLDVLIINQQFPSPLLTEARISALNELICQHPAVCCLADLRHSGLLIRGATLKVNTAELARFQNVPLPNHPDLDWCIEHARLLNRALRSPLVVTRGEAGMLYVRDDDIWAIDGLAVPGPLDPVGAGDTVVAALAASLSAGAPPPQALTIANLAAAVTVQKLGQTGTATPDEVFRLATTYTLHEPTTPSAAPSGTASSPDPSASSVLG